MSAGGKGFHLFEKVESLLSANFTFLVIPEKK